jgi:hypothetical protein
VVSWGTGLFSGFQNLAAGCLRRNPVMNKHIVSHHITYNFLQSFNKSPLAKDQQSWHLEIIFYERTPDLADHNHNSLSGQLWPVTGQSCFRASSDRAN